MDRGLQAHSAREAIGGAPGAAIRPTLRIAPPDAVDGSERRTAPRFTLLIRTAKLIAGDHEYLCVIRNAAAVGVRLKIFHPLRPREHFELELLNGDRFAMTIVWTDGELAGFRFAEPIDVERLLAEAPCDRPRRPIRVNCRIRATLFAASSRSEVWFRDISQRGARIECSQRLSLDERIRLESDVLPVIHATVRWRGDGCYGVMFETGFAYPELARLCAEASARANGADHGAPAHRDIAVSPPAWPPPA